MTLNRWDSKREEGEDEDRVIVSLVGWEKLEGGWCMDHRGE